MVFSIQSRVATTGSAASVQPSEAEAAGRSVPARQQAVEALRRSIEPKPGGARRFNGKLAAVPEADKPPPLLRMPSEVFTLIARNLVVDDIRSLHQAHPMLARQPADARSEATADHLIVNARGFEPDEEAGMEALPVDTVEVARAIDWTLAQLRALLPVDKTLPGQAWSDPAPGEDTTVHARQAVLTEQAARLVPSRFNDFHDHAALAMVRYYVQKLARHVDDLPPRQRERPLFELMTAQLLVNRSALRSARDPGDKNMALLLDIASRVDTEGGFRRLQVYAGLTGDDPAAERAALSDWRRLAAEPASKPQDETASKPADETEPARGWTLRILDTRPNARSLAPDYLGACRALALAADSDVLGAILAQRPFRFQNLLALHDTVRREKPEDATASLDRLVDIAEHAKVATLTPALAWACMGQLREDSRLADLAPVRRLARLIAGTPETLSASRGEALRYVVSAARGVAVAPDVAAVHLGICLDLAEALPESTRSRALDAVLPQQGLGEGEGTALDELWALHLAAPDETRRLGLLGRLCDLEAEVEAAREANADADGAASEPVTP